MVKSNYEVLIQKNLSRFFENLPPEPEKCLGAVRVGDGFQLRAFGQECVICPDRITFSGRPGKGPRSVVVSLYAVNTHPDPAVLEPFRSFREMPDSMPYRGAFSENSERVLVPFTGEIQQNQSHIEQVFDAPQEPFLTSGDFSLVLFPLPKIALQYIFYLPDEEFPASVTCLFSSNAHSFLPLDVLADVGEYTAKAVIENMNGAR